MKQLRIALAIAVVPTIAYILHDLVFQLPDNEGEASFGFFVTVGGLLCVWATSGYIIARAVNGIGSRIVVGAVAGLVSVGVLWLVFVMLNTLFIERMSYEANRIQAFHQSGYATWREWWNHQHGWGPFPLLGSVAAVVGAVGGSIRSGRPPAKSRD